MDIARDLIEQEDETERALAAFRPMIEGAVARLGQCRFEAHAQHAVEGGILGEPALLAGRIPSVDDVVRCHGFDNPACGDDELGQCRHIVAVEDRNRRIGNRSGGGDRHDGRIIAGKLRMIERQIAHFDLVVGVALVAFDDDEIAGRELGENFLKRRFGSRRAIHG